MTVRTYTLTITDTTATDIEITHRVFDALRPLKATASLNRQGSPLGTLVSVDDAAERVGLAPKTLRRLVSEGKLPAYRLGKRVIRVRDEDVDALFEPTFTATEQ